MAWYMHMLMRILTQLCTATCKVLMHWCMKQLLLTSLHAVLDGLGGVPGCGPGGDMDPVLAVSVNERGIQGNETLQV